MNHVNQQKENDIWGVPLSGMSMLVLGNLKLQAATAHVGNRTRILNQSPRNDHDAMQQ